MEPFTCPYCNSRRLAMGVYLNSDNSYCLRCDDCGFTQNFVTDLSFPSDDEFLSYFASSHEF